MADNTTRSTSDGIKSVELLQNLLFCGFSVLIQLSVYIFWILILILGTIYCCCKKYIKCRNTRHRGNRETDKLLDHDGESTSSCRSNRFCNSVEHITAGMVVDLLRTSNVTKEVDQDKKHKKVILKVGKAHSFVLGRNICNTFMIFFLVWSLLVLMGVKAFLCAFEQTLSYLFQPGVLDFTNEGENGVKAICYILENSTHPINCTTWNAQCDMPEGKEEHGIADGIVNTLSKIAGLYGLYAVLCLVYLSIALYTCCKQCCYKCCCCRCCSICMFIMLFILLPAIAKFLDHYSHSNSYIQRTSLTGGLLHSDVFLLLFIILHSILLAQVITSYSLESEQQRMMVVSEDTWTQERPILRERNNSNQEEGDTNSSPDENLSKEDHRDAITSRESGEGPVEYTRGTIVFNDAKDFQQHVDNS